VAVTLSSIRELMPRRPVTRAEGYRVAELQATRLLQLSGVIEPPVPEAVVAGLNRVYVERLSPVPVSGSTHWARGRWIIVLNENEPLVRQRYTLAHEAKHVLDHPFIGDLYPAQLAVTSTERAEQVADFFAAALLMPRVWVKRVWCDEGVQNLRQICRRFRVSQLAMQIRLLQLGLVEPVPRCEPQLTKRSKAPAFLERLDSKGSKRRAA
jgi:hypothetical protein